jgi:hypothetical protein
MIRATIREAAIGQTEEEMAMSGIFSIRNFRYDKGAGVVLVSFSKPFPFSP